jgi:hypothetical protein
MLIPEVLLDVEAVFHFVLCSFVEILNRQQFLAIATLRPVYILV